MVTSKYPLGVSTIVVVSARDKPEIHKRREKKMQLGNEREMNSGAGEWPLRYV
jgi:hypothetical protein